MKEYTRSDMIEKDITDAYQGLCLALVGGSYEEYLDYFFYPKKGILEEPSTGLYDYENP